MSLVASIETNELVALPDFDGERAKRLGVFLADLFAPGGTELHDLEPKNWEEVHRPLAGDVDMTSLRQVCALSGVTIEL